MMSYSLQERSHPLMNGNPNGFSNWNSNTSNLVNTNYTQQNPNNRFMNNSSNNNNNINNNHLNNSNNSVNNSNYVNNNNSVNNPNNVVGLSSIDTLDYRNKVIGNLPPQQSVQQVYSHQKLLQQQQQQIYLQKQKQYLLQQQQQQHFQNNPQLDLGLSNGNNSQININQNNINKSMQQQFSSIDNNNYDELIGRFKNLNSVDNNGNIINFQRQQQILLASNNGNNINNNGNNNNNNNNVLQQSKLYNGNNINNNGNNSYVNNNDNNLNGNIYNHHMDNSNGIINNSLNSSSSSSNNGIINNSSNGNINSSPNLNLGTMSPSIMGQLFSISQLSIPSLNGGNSINNNNSNNLNNNQSDFMNVGFDFGIPSFQSQFFNPVSHNLQQPIQIQQGNIQQLSPPQQSQPIPQSPQIRQQPPQNLLDSIHQIASIPEPINLSNSNNSIVSNNSNSNNNNKQPSPQQQSQSTSKPPTPTLELNQQILSNPINLDDSNSNYIDTTSTTCVNNNNSNSLNNSYSNNFLDETNFPTLNNSSKDLRKSQNNSPHLQTTSLGQSSIVTTNDKKEEKNSKKKKPVQVEPTHSTLSISSEMVETSKVKLSWFEFQTLSNSMSEADSEEPSRILWVGNIGMDVTEEELKDEFSNYGELESVRILHDRYCAFVNFKDTNNAISAKKHMHNQVIGSQYIVVNFRHPKATDDLAATNNVPITTPETLNSLSRAIYIGNVSENLPEKDIRKECEKYGEIESIRILRKKACAFVNFMNIQNATNALQSLNGKKLGDSIVRVNYGKPQPPIEKSNYK